MYVQIGSICFTISLRRPYVLNKWIPRSYISWAIYVTIQETLRSQEIVQFLNRLLRQSSLEPKSETRRGRHRTHSFILIVKPVNFYALILIVLWLYAAATHKTGRNNPFTRVRLGTLERLDVKRQCKLNYQVHIIMLYNIYDPGYSVNWIRRSLFHVSTSLRQTCVFTDLPISFAFIYSLRTLVFLALQPIKLLLSVTLNWLQYICILTRELSRIYVFTSINGR